MPSTNSDRPTHKQGAAIRSRVDYVVIALIYVILYLVGNKYSPGLSTKQDTDYFQWLFSQLGYYASFGLAGQDPSTWSNFIATWVSFWLLTVFGQAAITYGVCWPILTFFWPKTPMKFFAIQSKDLLFCNFWLLAAYQALWDFLIVKGFTKQTKDRTDPLSLVIDLSMWMFIFEISWYLQHRLMHEKFLWSLKVFGIDMGHSYHHGWRHKEHMIGITNFSFDQVVETWVTMSSSLFPMILFPSNFFAAKGIGLLYMLYAVMVHHEDFAKNVHQMHLAHHHRINMNFGSHFPFFDMMFGTYDWEGIDFARRHREFEERMAKDEETDGTKQIEKLVKRANSAKRKQTTRSRSSSARGKKKMN